MSSQEVPDRWASRLIEKGFKDRRFHGEDVPSLNALAREIEVHTSTVSAAIFQTRTPSADTIARIASALGDDVAGWLGSTYHGPWNPPAAAALLNDRQRNAIEELIRVMTEREQVADDGAQTQETAQKSRPRGSRASKPHGRGKGKVGREAHKESSQR